MRESQHGRPPDEEPVEAVRFRRHRLLRGRDRDVPHRRREGAHAIASPVTLVPIAKTLIVKSNKTIAQVNMLNTTK